MEIAQFSRATIGSAQVDRVKWISRVDVLVEDTKGAYILHMQDSGANLLRPQIDVPGTINNENEAISYSTVHAKQQSVHRVIAKLDSQTFQYCLILSRRMEKEWIPHLNVMRWEGTIYVDCEFTLQVTWKENSGTNETTFYLGKIE